MADVWSFNTTIRNPERVQNMLRVLAELEGVEFDHSGQEAFFSLIIKKRLYTPTRQTLKDPDLIAAVFNDDSADDIEDTLVERIVARYRDKEVDGAGRGRTAVGVLNRFGVCIALESKGKVSITQLGKKWLAAQIEDDDLFTRFFLKWEYPNKIESGYDSFSIKPFIGVLSLISRVNDFWIQNNKKPVGISKDEYKLFAASLKRAEDIETYAKRIIDYRQKKSKLSGKELTDFIDSFTKARGIEIFGNTPSLMKSLRNLTDYADSSIRYFHMSGMITRRGANHYIDISPDKLIEVQSILKKISPEPKGFNSFEEYLDYLVDTDSLILPWENEEDLKKISVQLTQVLDHEAGNQLSRSSLEDIKAKPLIKQVDTLQELINDVRLGKLRGLRHNTNDLGESIINLQSLKNDNYKTTTSRPSLDFEWFTTRALMVLNDAKNIIPSFKVGDDGIPTGFRGSKADIECYYENFSMTVEVTLLLGRDQWYAEGQPVQRHLRDFEDKSPTEKNYSLFIAPIIHRDSLNTFWMSNKLGYEGRVQKIVPLTTKQFVDILKVAERKIKLGNFLHSDIERLFDSFFRNIENESDSNKWLEMLDNRIREWN